MQIIKFKLGNHNWRVRFLPTHLMRENENGTCWTGKRCIDIDESMDDKETKLVLTHEIVHALMATQGRVYEEGLCNESVCEFIAWNIDEIVSVRNKIMERRRNGN